MSRKELEKYLVEEVGQKKFQEILKQTIEKYQNLEK